MAATTPGALFDTVLVANRGEIACRVIRTLRRLGIRSVAVYSEADADARHVREADLAVYLGPAPAAQSYLDISAVIEACRISGAQAVHPGYGFLSENPAFGQALEEAGIIFIGPGALALEVMGDKIRAKNHVAAHGVPVTPGIAELGTDGKGLDDAALIAAAEDIGFPLLIKPSAGGGGKGMQAVHSAAELPETLLTARRVARSAFGDDTLFLERLIADPRHIEVQILADQHGNVVHLGERECSLQRRHQKVIEEAPSALLNAQTKENQRIRAELGQAACDAARSVGYRGAGTIEFLVSDAAPGEFFFMEMNTRLQVEHPVTEMVTGVDLVEWQIRIAAGEPLTMSQEDIRLDGHAVEARVYAEDPQRGFIPQTGTVRGLREPLAGRHPQTAGRVRVDSALIPGLEVSGHYDPMLAKVIAWGTDRQHALDTLEAALAETVVLGVGTNIEYLRLLLVDPEVQEGRLDTSLIERKLPDLRFAAPAAQDLRAATWYLTRLEEQRRTAVLAGQRADAESLWARVDGWRLGQPSAVAFSLGTGAEALCAYAQEGSAATEEFRWEGEYLVAEGQGRGHRTRQSWLIADDLEAAASALGESAAESDSRPQPTLWLSPAVAGRHAGVVFTVHQLSRAEAVAEQVARSRADRKGVTADPAVRSPMPGTVVSVSVADGEPVQAGQNLLAVEAMKMEHQLQAAVDGVAKFAVRTGDLVKAGQIVATIEPADTIEEQATEEQERP
ncbi:biotin/lipoyl-binding protein [Acaricomes phytoseiuli]|uniref:ATP-binding protein n=1 Tax=Acaricomes phytoseiuli TaxID=291968 RepID=UPI002221EF5A|nr:biotin carboxylase N-terminal domain-containing protein [Acaricomes phytoseiuli]MCW1249806.1 biotin/lipoyl-binding protein [Acaricomes phytoseiuli]